MVGDERDKVKADNHKLASALGMAIGHTRRHCARFAREAIRKPRMENCNPDDMTRETDDVARLELASVRTYVHEENSCRSYAPLNPLRIEMKASR